MIMKKNSSQNFRDNFEESLEKREGDDDFHFGREREKKSRPYKKRRIKPAHKNWEH